MWVLETNVDDLDPRLWPTCCSALLERGAADAWLVPVLMKKGRPAHTLLRARPDAEREALRDAVLSLTSTLGMRRAPGARGRAGAGLAHGRRARREVRVKIGLRAGRIVHATPEFEDVAALADGAASRSRRCWTRRSPPPRPPGSARARRGHAGQAGAAI